MTLLYRISTAIVCFLLVTAWVFVVALGCFDDLMADSPTHPVGPNHQVAAHQVFDLWPETPPVWNSPPTSEGNTSGPESRKVAGRAVVRIGNVRTPQLHVYHPVSGPSETVVLVCPGGGYSILAWDLEGTEIATWLASVGATAMVVKYRVPTREEADTWLAPVQDIQRALSLVRSGAIDGVDAKQVGLLGFSAGANAAARTAFSTKRYYDPVDVHDEASCKCDFSVLVYPAWLNEKDSTDLIDELQVTHQSPPMFLVHATNDGISSLSSLAVYAALKQKNVPAELHVFSSGGHGFGGRLSGQPTDAWPDLCAAWMTFRGWLKPIPADAGE